MQSTPEVRRRVVAAFEMLRAWGPMLTLRYFSAYIDLPGQALILYSPTVNWGRAADTNSKTMSTRRIKSPSPSTTRLAKVCGRPCTLTTKP